MAQNSVKPLLLASFNSAGMTGNYQVANGLGFAHAPFLVRIINASNAAVTVSFNGVDDHDFIPANSVLVLPTQSESQPKAQVALFPKNTKVFLKGAAGVGIIYVAGYFV